MNKVTFLNRTIDTARHRTAWIEAGPESGQLLIFLHGWPEVSLVWRAQLERFAADGWRCVAPDMRGYGGSSVPDSTAAYAVRELVADMIELHDALGGQPAVWVAHDWGSAVAWALAAHYPERCIGVVNLCVPYIARGFTLPNLVALVDRDLYPAELYPVGQWDYWLYHREQFAQSAADLEADVPATIATFYRSSSPAKAGQRPPLASLRAGSGWFGPAHRAPSQPRDDAFMPLADHDAVVAAFSSSGFAGANAWYLNDAANEAYAAAAPNFGHLALPVLFLHASWDTVCDTVRSRLAEPMRMDCAHLSEVTIAGGHELMLEQPDAVNEAISDWLSI